ncbi:hypothetical protein BC829DRAFT_362959, partial [Chytridium lagenaria]
CPFIGCGKFFSRSHNLKSHLRTHADEKPFECSFCQRRFMRNHDLKARFDSRHVRKHTNERPYICSACGKRFVRSDAMNRYVYLHQAFVFKSNGYSLIPCT